MEEMKAQNCHLFYKKFHLLEKEKYKHKAIQDNQLNN